MLQLPDAGRFILHESLETYIWRSNLSRRGENPFWDLVAAMAEAQNNRRRAFVTAANMDTLAEPLGPIPDAVDDTNLKFFKFYPDDGKPTNFIVNTLTDLNSFYLAAPVMEESSDMLYRLFKKYVPRSRRNKYTRAIRQFVNSDDTVLTFPSTLNTIERRWIHNIAEQWKLKHESFGLGEERYIVVTKLFEGKTFK